MARIIARTIIIIVFLGNALFSVAQSYGNLKIKEEYDLFNINVVNNQPCIVDPNDDAEEFGDNLSFVLDSYITMYKTTKDKAYLYKFMLEVICVVDNRHDFAGINTEPRWGDPYHDGYIIAAMARFVYLVKVEELSLGSQLLHPFPELSSYSFFYPTAVNNFWLFADWLSNRVDETLDWYISNGTFDSNIGMLKDQAQNVAFELNQQVGFGRAALLNGLTNPPNASTYLQRANKMASLIKGGVAFNDRCAGVTYNQNTLRYSSVPDSYWWYHQGWAVPKGTCTDPHFIIPFTRHNEPLYSSYTGKIEDISHAAVDLMLFNDLHEFQQPVKIIDNPDMIRFRNMFTKVLYDNGGGFNNAVTGSDGPIQHKDCTTCPHNYYKIRSRSMCYMPLEEFDIAAASTPNVYNIIMDFYQINLTNLPAKPSEYSGLDNKGHADVVAAQWKHECYNLELYNRNVVYDQDFFAKNKLIITPGTSNLPSGASYAAPTIYTKEFIVANNVVVNMTAGESISLKPGVQIKSGPVSKFKAYIIPTAACTDGMRLASDNTGKGDANQSSLPIINPNNEDAKQSLNNVLKLRAVPNPFTNSTNIQFSLDLESKVNLKLIDNFGRIVYESKEDINCTVGFNEVSISTETLTQGLYNCILKINNEEIQTINIVKQ